MSTQALDAAENLSAAGATHPRVSVKSMEDKIARKYFFTAGVALSALVTANLQDPDPTWRASPNDPLDLLTLCILVMQNGFTVVGKSAPASPENFDPEKGRTFAYEDAIKQLWPLEGYALRDALALQADVAAKL